MRLFIHLTKYSFCEKEDLKKNMGYVSHASICTFKADFLERAKSRSFQRYSSECVSAYV